MQRLKTVINSRKSKAKYTKDDNYYLLLRQTKASERNVIFGAILAAALAVLTFFQWNTSRAVRDLEFARSYPRVSLVETEHFPALDGEAVFLPLRFDFRPNSGIAQVGGATIREAAILHGRSSGKMLGCTIRIQNFFQWSGSPGRYEISKPGVNFYNYVQEGGIGSDDWWFQHVAVLYSLEYTDIFNKYDVQNGVSIGGQQLGSNKYSVADNYQGLTIILANASSDNRVIFAQLSKFPLSPECSRAVSYLDSLPKVSLSTAYLTANGNIVPALSVSGEVPSFYALKDPDVPDRNDNPLENIVIVPGGG